jgi:inorganic phosphate transporter, PiT family
MTLLLFGLVLLAVLVLAFSNGANDNFKGVSTLFGSGVTNYRTALIWATVTTLAGSMLALYLAHGLVDKFKGKDLVPDAIIAQPAFILAVSLGAAITVLLATRLGFPISTTHALTGGLVGAGLAAAGNDVEFAVLGSSFVLPLLLIPVAAITLTVLAYPLFRLGRRVLGVTRRTCVCIGSSYEEVAPLPDGTLALVRPAAPVRVWSAAECVERYQGRVLGLDAGQAVDGLHYLSGGAVGFARGLNDTPKIIALLFAASAAGEYMNPNVGLALVGLVMAVGGILNARRVAETMSRKITRMNPGQGFTANLATAILVLCASLFKLPVSTTHVSVGSLFGIGIISWTARIKTILSILIAWVTTLPCAAVLAAGVYLLLRTVGVDDVSGR